MEAKASLLVSPKPSMAATVVSARASARGRTRRCLVVAAAATTGGHSKEPGSSPETVIMMRARARGGLLAAIAAASSTPVCDAWALPLGDLDPATATTVAGVAGPALSALGFLFILRIVMSWYPRLPVTEFPYVLAYAPTEPFLAVTRKIIPPLGGVDVTPVVWFGIVSFLNEILVGPQGLLVMLSQQQQQQL